MNITDMKYAVNYYEIVNFVYDKDDIITDRLITYYKNYFLNIIPKENYKINYIDMIIDKYLNDVYFNSYIKNNIEDDIDYYYDLDYYLIKLYNDYEDIKNRKIAISKWL